MPKLTKQRNQTTELIKKVGSRAVEFQTNSTKHVKRHLIGRTEKVVGVRRFVAGWLLLVLFLCFVTAGVFVQIRKSVRTDAPAVGGTYTEGLKGEISNLNPLFGSGLLDESIAKLVFNGLYRYDTNGKLVPDIATTTEVDETKKVYTVTIRKDVLWHDGQPLQADDVVYTINAIQNTQTRSTRFSSWQGIKVSMVSNYQVKFELPAPFAPFPNSLTIPILPKHLLNEIKYDYLRTASFNTNPVGTGPFVFTALRNQAGNQQQAEFTKNTNYFRGAPKLDRFVIQTFADDESLERALKNREITAAVDLSAESVERFSTDTSIRPVDIPLNSGVFAFFKTTNPILADANVRAALAQSTDRLPILQLFNARYAPLKTPLLPSQLGYDSTYQQQTNVAEAEKKLDAAGWVKQPNGIRAKDGVPLEFGLTTLDTPQYISLAANLKKQWAAVGVSVKPQLLASEQFQQNARIAHSYDILLFGISLDYDPDVYAYWHSSQARTSGLNFSEWKSDRADSSLDVARTRLESVLRIARYQTFQDEWLKGTPAVALYQPRLNYAYHQNATGFVPFASTNASERLTNIEEWTVNTRSVERTP